MKKLILLPLLSLFVFSNLNAQNYLFDKGQSGFSIAGLYATSENNGISSSAYGINPMYTLNGKLTFGLSVSSNKIEDSSGTEIAPSLSYVFLKKPVIPGFLMPV